MQGLRAPVVLNLFVVLTNLRHIIGYLVFIHALLTTGDPV